MDFLKGLFKGKKIKGVEISVSSGGLPPGLAQLFGGVEHLFRASKERRAFFEKEMEALQERMDSAKTEMWKSVETYMREHGLWPEGVPHDGDPCLALRNGVIMHHKHDGEG